jgi:hypothetical protein
MPQALPISQQKALTITYKMETDTNPRGIAPGVLDTLFFMLRAALVHRARCTPRARSAESALAENAFTEDAVGENAGEEPARTR